MKEPSTQTATPIPWRAGHRRAMLRVAEELRTRDVALARIRLHDAPIRSERDAPIAIARSTAASR